jgi:hypothetical protein
MLFVPADATASRRDLLREHMDGMLYVPCNAAL